MRALLFLPLLACSPEPTPTPSPSSDLPSAAELAALDEAGQAFLDALPDAEAGREAALAALQADVRVGDVARVGAALPVRFPSGVRSGLSTQHPGPGAPGFAEAEEAIAALWPARTFLARPVAPPPALAPRSHRVLLLSSASEQADGADLGALEARRRELIASHCYEPEDVVIRTNLAEDGFSTLHAEDLLDLSGFGVVLLNSPGSTVFEGDTLGTRPLLQVGALGEPTAREEALIGAGDMVVQQVYDPTDDAFDTYRHLDLFAWSEAVTLDPGAIVILSASDGMMASTELLNRGAGAVVGWTGPAPDPWGSDTAALMLAHLVNGGDPVGQTVEDAVFLFDAMDIDRDVPDARVAEGDVGMPTWMTVGAGGWPDGAVTVRTTLAYADASLPAPDPATLEDVAGSPNTFDGLIPGAELIVTAEALDGSGAVLATGVERTTPGPGGCNEAFVLFGDHALTLLAWPDLLLVGDPDTVLVQVAAWDHDDEEDTWIALPDVEVTLTTSAGTWGGVGDEVTVTTGPDGVAAATLWPPVGAGVAHIVATWGEVTASTEVRVVDADYVEDFEGLPGPEWSTSARFSFGGDMALGPLGEAGTTLTLDGLPAHASVDLDLDVVLTGNWSGGWIGVEIDGDAPGSPGWTTGLVWGAGTLSGMGARPAGLSVPHHGETLVVRFWAMEESWPDDDDPHDWGIDDVRVRLAAP